jgi:histidinol-phosphatase (PHP family)
MPWFSYHGGHSGQFCRHAKGTLGAVVARAIDAGFTTYGLSEHCARWRSEDRFPDELDLSPDDLVALFDDYVAEARRLRDAHADRLEILLGFETEVLPPERWPAAMRGVRAAIPDCDYMIGSVHHVDGLPIDSSPALYTRAVDAAGGAEALRLAYFALVERVATELAPEVLGHFDLVRKFDRDALDGTPRLRAAIDRALEATRAAGCALDVNAAPHRRGLGPVYPQPWILARACAMGIPVTLGDDSHGAHDVGVGLDACVAAIARAGYREIHYLTRRDGAVRLVAAPIDTVRPERAA